MRKIYLLSFLLLFACKKDPIQYSLFVSANPPEGGLVNPTSGIYESGESVNIQASSNEDYGFVGWTGDWNSDNSTIILLMDSDKNLIANFSIRDFDNDGILDKNDQCPATPGSSPSGCPDIDNDGILDRNDFCQNTNPGKDVDEYGCAAHQLDDDEDGVDNEADQCPNTNILLDVESNGCKIDYVYLDENGITLKAYENTPTGKYSELNGKIYEIVDRGRLDFLININHDLSLVITSNISDMSDLNNGSINSGISNWDVSNVTNMRYMFMFSPFNEDISNWDVSNVTDMRGMFIGASFNNDIGDWDVSNVTDMSYMFRDSKFNNDIGDWDVSSVVNMSFMFKDVNSLNNPVTLFNQPIGGWNVSNVTNMQEMFMGNQNFNQDISGWDVSNVTNMTRMFMESNSFSYNLSNWNVSSVTECSVFACLSGSSCYRSNFPQSYLPNFINCNN